MDGVCLGEGEGGVVHRAPAAGTEVVVLGESLERVTLFNRTPGS